MLQHISMQSWTKEPWIDHQIDHQINKITFIFHWTNIVASALQSGVKLTGISNPSAVVINNENV